MAHHHKLNCLVKRLDFSVVIKVKVTEMVNNSSDCSSGLYLLDCWTFHNQTWYGNSSSWARVSCMEILFAVFKFKVTVKDNISKICLFYIWSELLILWQLNLVWWHIIIRRIVLRKDWIALLWFSEYSPGQYLLSCWTFCNWTWYGDGTLWAKVSCKKTGLLSLV